MRARLRSTIGGESQVPYFLLPTLGGGSSLRAHSSWRFRDRHAADATLEWRWIPNRAALDMAVFFDAGQVADEFNALRPNRFATNVGVGVRLHARQFMVMRMDVAHGSAGWHLTISNKVPF
jgi:hemolysin activation/secretion protein